MHETHLVSIEQCETMEHIEFTNIFTKNMINKNPKYDAPAILVIVRDTFLFTIPWTININSDKVAKAK